MSVPVYLFTGFLDSGKTSFLQDTLRDPQFHSGEKTLILICEDGEVEYDETVMSAYNCDVVYVQQEQDLSYDYLKALDRQYRPERVMIEFNGMWNVTNFLDVEYPLEWLLVQIMTTVDASTFAMYMNNMRSILYDQLVHSELIIFNRCDETTKKSFLRGNVKAMNKGAQLIYENKDGAINQLADDELPFDVSSALLDIKEEDFGLWYMDVMERPGFYEGKIVTFVGQIVEVDKESGAMFLIGREAMVCCAEDIQTIGFIVHDVKECKRKKGVWIKLTAEMKCAYDEAYGGDVAILYAKQIEEAKPIQDLVSFS